VLNFGHVTVSMSANSSSSIIRFGTFELDLQTGELRHAGRKVKLQEQPFQVLTALLEHPGKIVTREELRSKLWPAETFVDFDHGLNAAIKRLRDALSESADAPVYIETLARRDYRFIAPVNGSSSPGEIGISAAPVHRPWKRTAMIAVAGCFVAAGLLYVGIKPSRERLLRLVKLQRLTEVPSRHCQEQCCQRPSHQTAVRLRLHGMEEALRMDTTSTSESSDRKGRYA
jgi:DNA-binding winged helix-turn-helix (wHTH) protein